MKIKNQGLTERNDIFYNNQKITELQLSGMELNRVEGAMDSLPITLGPSTTSASVTLQLFYEDIPMEDPKSFTWQANHSGPTQALFDTIFTSDLGKTAEILRTNPTLINATDESGNTALHKALEKKDIDENLIRLLLDHGADPKVTNKEFYHDKTLLWGGETPLHEALEENENITPEIIKLILNRHPNMAKVKNKKDASLLQKAARNPKMTEEMINLLIDEGVDPSEKDSYGGLAVERAANGGNLAAFKTLFGKTPGIDVNTQDKDGHTLLQLAAWTNSVDVIKSLLNMPGIDVNSLVNWGFSNKKVTVLRECVGTSRDPEVIELLLQASGNNVNATYEDGKTLLHFAVEEYMERPWPSNLPTIEVLLKHHADKDLPNNHGITPRQLVAASSHEELKKLFGIQAP